MIRNPYSPLWICLFVMMLVRPPGNALANEYFVSTTGGSDSFTGDREHPFRTIQKAAGIMMPGDICRIRGGIYREEVKPLRSGADGAPIRFEAYEDEAVWLTGTERVSPASWRSQTSGVFRADMGRIGPVSQVFAGWRQMDLARHPNNPNPDLLDPQWGTADRAVAANLPGLSSISDDLLDDGSVNWKGADLWLLSGLKWVAFTSKIESHSGGTVRFGFEPGSEEAYRPQTGSRYFITGALAALDAEREWFYEVAGKMLYFSPPGGGTPASLDVDVRVRRWGFDLSGLRNIHISKIRFFAASVTFHLSESCRLEDSRVYFPAPFYAADGWSHTEDPQNSPGAGVLLDGESNALRNCEVAYSWGDGVTVSGSGNTVENCLIHDVNWLCTDAAAIHTSGRGHVLSANTIFRAARSGLVHRKSGGLLIAYNDIHDCGLLTTDLGATYCYQTDGMGTVIQHNWVHDVVTEGHTAGIYLDNGSSNFIVHHNVVWNTDAIGIQTNLDAANHAIFNNTIWNVGQAMGGGGGNEQLVDQKVYNNLSNSGAWFGTDLRGNLALSDPSFMDERRGDFRLRSDSPARDDYDATARFMNGGFEAGISGWTGAGCTLTAVDSPVRSGALACLAHDRHMYWEGARQAITDVLKDHGPGKYTIEAWVRTESGAVSAYLRFKLVDGMGESYPGTTIPCGSGEWKKISFSQTLSWQGTLKEAVFELMTTESDNALPDLFVDDCQLLAPAASAQKIGGVPISGITDDVTDGKPDAGAYEFGGAQADWKAGSTVLPADQDISETESGQPRPEQFRLKPVSPNPFHSTTSIEFDLPEEAEIRLELFNVLGRRIRILLSGRSSAGIRRIQWDGRSDADLLMPSGLYILRLTAGTGSQSWSGNQKLVRVR
jgi:hypothetical protein